MEEQGIIILDNNYDGKLDRELLSIRVSAKTSEDNYGYRSLENYTIVIYDEKNKWIEFESTGQNFKELKKRKRSCISKDIGDEIIRLFAIDCPYGKYPEVIINLYNHQYEVIYEDYNTDKNIGYLTAEYRILIHIKKGG